MVMLENILFGLLLSTFAGLATTVGAFFAFFVPSDSSKSKSILGGSLGFSAGVMISVSFVELLPTAIEQTDFFLANFVFFIGFVSIMLVDFIIPHSYEAEESGDSGESKSKSDKELENVGMMTALGIAIHNFPEGLASFAGSLINPALGMTTAIAIAIHNAPEGLSVAVPLSYSSNQKKKAFWIATFSGFAEPIGALVGALILLPFLDQLGSLIALLLAFVAGIMIFISFDELLPAARKYGEAHLTTFMLLIGMFVMTATLIIFNLG